MTTSLQAGFARRVITPPLGTELFGYPTVRHGHEIDDDLNATVLALKDGETTACLIALDLCLIDEEELESIRRDVSAATGIAPFDITVCASHTHSGPVTVTASGWGYKNQGYLDQARAGMVEAAKEAVEKLQPVTAGIGVTKTDVGINRREITPNGDVGLGFNPWGPRDEDLTVMRLVGADGPVATLLHLSAHPTSRGHCPKISRDWPGVTIDRLEKITGVPVIFINGSFGDVAPRTSIGGSVGDGAPAAEEVGLRAAAHAIEAYNGIKEYRELALQTYSGIVTMPHAPLAPLEEAQTNLAQYPNGESERGAAGCEWHYWTSVIKAHSEAPCPAREWQQTLTRIGPLVIVPFAGEIFSEIALRVKRESPFAHTLCAGTSNGSHGYYVTRESRGRGGYEVWVARAYGAQLLADNIDDVLVKENVRLLNELSAQS